MTVPAVAVDSLDLVVRAQADPLRDWPVLLLLLRERPLRGESLVRRHLLEIEAMGREGGDGRFERAALSSICSGRCPYRHSRAGRGGRVGLTSQDSGPDGM